MQIDAYISYIAHVRRYSPRTQEIYRAVLEEYEEHSGGALTPTAIRNYEVYLLDQKEGKKDCARTVGMHLSVLSGYCRWLMKNGQLESNPVRLVPRPEIEKRLPVFYREDSMKQYFDDTASDASGEQLEFLQSLPDGDKTAKILYTRRLDRLVISMLYGTGMRRSELISLNRNSIDFSRRTVSVLGKGSKMREIPLVPSLCEEISLYLSAADHVLGASEGSTPLLRTPSGSRLYPVYVDRTVKKELGAVAGITGRKSPHVLRHTLASELLDNGSDLNSIKELLGHSSLAATQVYTHNTIERLKKVYNQAHPRANKNTGNYGD